MRMRKKPNLDARMGRCAHLLVANPEEYRGRWLSEFGADDELHVELGCGKGLFTVETANAAPGALIAALEKSADAMIIGMERAAASELRNIRFINAYADDIMRFFAPGEVARFYINFCDPWPSNKHSKRRLTNRRFLELYAQMLRPGGEIRFKTDNLPLFEFSLGEFGHSGFEALELIRDLHKDGPVGVMTDYELKFHALGMPIYMCIMRKL